MIHAAGILYVCGGKALFVQRADTGQWAFPGGHIEAGETAEQAAEREAREELGDAAPDVKRAELTRRVADGVDFTTFVARVDAEFAPALNGEHTSWCWAPIDNPPQPLHPGCAVALARPGMDELDVARAMAAGDLVSPQQYGEMWLWAIRITGTGASYRAGLNEYVWRDSSLYLNDRFLARISGLPVVWEHPEKKPKLDSAEFNDRIIGTVMMPYISGDEVWAVCRLYDADAITLMLNEQLSTSPGVVFKPSSGNQTVPLEDGSHLLLEGAPWLVDHICVCPAGVWDKGGPPTGVLTDSLQQEPIGMTEEEKAVADKARKDADEAMQAKLDEMQAKLDAANARLDAAEAAEAERADRARKDADEAKSRRDAARKDRFGARKDGEDDAAYKARCDADEEAEREALKEEGEGEEAATDKARKARKDAEEADGKARADKARQDAEEKERMERDDAARADAALRTENADLKARLAALEGAFTSLTRETPAEERNALAAAQARADGIAGLFGERAVPPLPGESGVDYRKRLASKFKQHSARFKETDLSRCDAAMLSAVEDIIYNDAAAAARSPGRASAGVLIPIVERDMAGRQITRFTGDPMAWMQHFTGQAAVGKINRNPKAA